MNEVIFPNAESSALLVVDIQERLVPAIEDTQRERLLRQNGVLIECARTFGWQTVYSEQYPKGLGPTVPALREALEAADARRIEKVEFSCCRNPVFAEEVLSRLPPHVVVTGMEAHICVLQTVADLQARGHQVFVPWDAVGSRTAANRDNGLALIERAGAVVTNTETILFHALGRAGGDDFKRLSKMIR